MTQKTKIADYIIDFIGERGVTEIFMLYGAANGHLTDGFTRTDKTRYIATMHEQGAGFAAECYSRTKGVPAVALVTSGPGAHNLVTSIANCFYDSVPAIFLTGQINANFLRNDPSIRQVGFQESDIVSIVEPITKWAKMITKPEEAKYVMERAWRIATEGRPGPVVIDVPINIQEAYVDLDACHGLNSDVLTPAYNAETVGRQIDEYLDDLERAERPVLLIGGGVRGAGCVDLLSDVMDILQVPAYPTWNGLDAVKEDCTWYGGRVGTYGGPGRNLGIQNTDLLMAIGSRISGRVTGGNVHTFAREAKKCVVDVDEALLQPHLQQVPFDLNIHADLPLFLTLLKDKAKARGIERKDSWVAQCMDWKNRYDTVQEWMFADDAYVYDGQPYVHPYAFLRDLGRAAPDDTIFVGDLGGISAAVGHALELHGDQRFQTSNGNAPMGFSFAAAMGSKVAAPGRQVIAIIGDGGMNVNIQELQTLLNYDIRLKTVILNNHIYGITKAYQQTNFEGRMEACGPVGYSPPDFVKVCEAYGIETLQCSTNADRADSIRALLDHPGPVVMDVNMHEYHTYEPRIFGWSTPIEDMYPYLDREELRAQLYIKPHETFDTPVYPNFASKSDTKTME